VNNLEGNAIASEVDRDLIGDLGAVVGKPGPGKISHSPPLALERAQAICNLGAEQAALKWSNAS
jgi:hypothetical protein